MINDETIEQKLLRLNSTRTGMADNRSEGYFSFSVVCELLEMAIAEEREAAWKIGEESWAKESVAIIRQRSAPKDEASE